MRDRFSEEIKKIICEAIAREGTDRAGWETGNISKATFYAWLQKYPTFREAVEQAKEQFTRDRPEAEKQQARKCLSDYLYHGVTIEWETSGETVRNIEDPDGTIKQVIREKFRKQHFERRQCPAWVIDRVLGKNTAILDAMQFLLTENIASPEQARIVAEGILEIERKLKQEAENLAPEGLA